MNLIFYLYVVWTKVATRWLSYIVDGVVDGERGYFLHIQPVHVLLKQTEQGEVQGGQSGLLALTKSRKKKRESMKVKGWTGIRHAQVKIQETEEQ